MTRSITEHVVKTRRHTTFYLACGPTIGTPLVFLHGWPELSISWRHQLSVFAALGFRAIAPDMRGYGRATVYDSHAAYGQTEIVQDMLELLDGIGAARAIWVGHDAAARRVASRRNAPGAQQSLIHAEAASETARDSAPRRGMARSPSQSGYQQVLVAPIKLAT